MPIVPPNPGLQRAGARGSILEWLVREAEVAHVLCGWRGRPPLRGRFVGGHPRRCAVHRAVAATWRLTPVRLSVPT